MVAPATKSVALIIDDEKSICESLSGVLSDEGWVCRTAHSGRQGLIEFKLAAPQIVFLDVWMPGMDGIETLQKIREMNQRTPVVIMSGHGTIETAVRATKLGAFDFLEKPLSLEKIIPLLEQARSASQQSEAALPADKARLQLIGVSSAVESVRRQINMVGPRNSWVLITGENGTGKEVVARNIHVASSRSSKPFIAVNCAAIPEELIESELFGHAKGAFTNAVAMKKGRFELAHQGTLFLDEIGDMSLRTQAKILRILQERSFERLGDDETIQVDVRVIAATNKNLPEEISAGKFREDLYYRLNVIPVTLAPLRERLEDIPVLLQHFLALSALELQEPAKTISPEAMHVLQQYEWPGNIRELKNLIERLSILVVGPRIELHDLPEDMGRGVRLEDDMEFHASSGASLRQAKLDFEKSFILERLEENQWNVSKTADAIGIERSNLHRKLRVYEIDPKRLKG